MLALNRGEQNKILTIKLTVPEQVEKQFLTHLRQVWIPCDAPGNLLCSVRVEALTNCQKQQADWPVTKCDALLSSAEL